MNRHPQNAGINRSSRIILKTGKSNPIKNCLRDLSQGSDFEKSRCMRDELSVLSRLAKSPFTSSNNLKDFKAKHQPNSIIDNGQIDYCKFVPPSKIRHARHSSTRTHLQATDTSIFSRTADSKAFTSNSKYRLTNKYSHTRTPSSNLISISGQHSTGHIATHTSDKPSHFTHAKSSLASPPGITQRPILPGCLSNSEYQLSIPVADIERQSAQAFRHMFDVAGSPHHDLANSFVNDFIDNSVKGKIRLPASTRSPIDARQTGKPSAIANMMTARPVRVECFANHRVPDIMRLGITRDIEREYRAAKIDMQTSKVQRKIKEIEDEKQNPYADAVTDEIVRKSKSSLKFDLSTEVSRLPIYLSKGISRAKAIVEATDKLQETIVINKVTKRPPILPIVREKVLRLLRKLDWFRISLNQFQKHKLFPSSPFTYGALTRQFLHHVKNDEVMPLFRILNQNPYVVYDFDSTGQTALIWASKRGLTEMVDFLIGNKSDPDAVDMFNRTPLYLAIKLNNEHIVRSLLIARSMPEDEYHDYEQVAIDNGCLRIRLLINRTKRTIRKMKAFHPKIRYQMWPGIIEQQLDINSK